MTAYPKRKVLLVGWDAADWVILQPLLDKGLMPCLAKLLERGVSGKISTLRPILSPMLWNSVATGKRPDQHGIRGFVEPKPDGSGIRPVTSTSRQCKAIWNILSQNDLRSIVVNWFASFPAEPIKGVVVTDRYVTQSQILPQKRHVGPAMVHPSDLASSLAELIVNPAELDAGTILSFIPQGKLVDQDKDDRVRKLAHLIAKMSTIHAAACKTMLQHPWDFMAVYYDAIDHFGHTFMPYHPPAMEGIDPQDAEIYGPCVTGCYQFQDMMLGAMLQYAGDDTTVIVVSDHGFHSEQDRPGTDGYKDPVSWHRPYGVVTVAGPGIRQGEKISGVNLIDITPTILSMFDLPIAKDMDGRPWLEIYDSPKQVEHIESWESIPGEDGMHPEDFREDPAAAALAIKQLVDLGYVEAPDEDVEKQVHNTIRTNKCSLAVALTYSRRREQAVVLWRELIVEAEDTDLRHGYQMQLATCLMRMGKFDEVEKILYSFGPKGLHTVAVQMMLATIRLHQDRGKEALEHLESVTSKVPADNSQFVAQLGLAYLKTYQLAKAHEQFDRALAGDDENVIAFFGMAELSNARGQYHQAVDYALRAIELADAVPAGHFQLGFALSKLGMIDEALLAVETYLQLSPSVKKGQELHQELLSLQSEASRIGQSSPDSKALSEASSARVRRYAESEKDAGLQSQTQTD